MFESERLKSTEQSMSISPKIQSEIFVVAALFLRNNDGVFEFALFKRADHTSYGGCWEFPGGKIEPGEDEVTALRREMLEELSIEVEVVSLVDRCVVDVDTQKGLRRIHMAVYRVESLVGHNWKLSDHDEVKWISQSETVGLETSLNLAPADVPILRNLWKKINL